MACLFQEVREFADYPDNVVQYYMDPRKYQDGMQYLNVDEIAAEASDHDTLCIDDMRDATYSAVVLKKWRDSGYGVATVHASLGRGLDRIATLTASFGGQSTPVIDACIYLEHRRGKLSVHSIDLSKVARRG
ncbi:hypothetical protein [Cupriavidus sp. UYPR2.512]|uniref:hypothetical protein n=1 Tax=Cupriavidus sp. UYPR2.512 TaxID=1080187 RepID=UPI0003798C38|nr:hypothetical protein [Cupriavidus sp. UYPR2.512]UIF89267.1 hypothetical protein KAF44_30280 [Cupriavidus necator]